MDLINGAIIAIGGTIVLAGIVVPVVGYLIDSKERPERSELCIKRVKL